MSALVEDLSDMLTFTVGNQSGPLSRLLAQRALNPVFQPIASLNDGALYAHEALIRGPSGMPLQSPDALLAAARKEGLLQDFEVACVVFALERWIALHQPGRLFVNISASALVRCFSGRRGDLIANRVGDFGLQPHKLVFELTEHERVTDVASLVDVATELQAAGMAIALDDFGDGRSSLRLWSELSPDIVKIDKYFTQDIARQGKKVKTIRGLMLIAETFGTALVAEGIETGDDLRVLRDLGITYGQGYLLGRPLPEPRTVVSAEANVLLADRRVAVMPTLRMAATPGRFHRGQIIDAETVRRHTTNDQVHALFQANPEWHAIAVVEDDIPVALIGRQKFLDRCAQQYFKELFGRKPCIKFASAQPTTIELDHDIHDLIHVLTSQDQRYLSEGFVYTENGRYRGLGTGHQLVRQVTESRIEAARHANPLTLLPGNIPISEHIERLLAASASFVACYADLSCFKPFNDHYGYWRGDEMIKLLAATISRHCDPSRDFVGHVGGDDFVILFQSQDWAQRIDHAITSFNDQARGLYDEEALLAGGIEAEDRDGVKRFFGFTTAYFGVVEVGADTPLRNAAHVANAAARAKQMAKVKDRAVCAA